MSYADFEDADCLDSRIYNTPHPEKFCFFGDDNGTPRRNPKTERLCGMKTTDEGKNICYNRFAKATDAYYHNRNTYLADISDAMREATNEPVDTNTMCADHVPVLDTVARTAAFNILASTDNPNMYDVTTIFKNARVLKAVDKGSASSTIIMFGTINAQIPLQCTESAKAVAKLSWPNHNRPDYNGLVAEREIYIAVRELLTSRVTPHITSVMSVRELQWPAKPPPAGTNARQVYTDILAQLQDINSDIIQDKNKTLTRIEKLPISCVITVDCGGMSLEKWINKSESKPTFRHDSTCLFFQLMYTLKALANIGVQHNDLHFGNAMVQELKHPVVVQYTYTDDEGEQTVKIVTNVVLKMYDWDRSHKVGKRTGTNRRKIANTTIDESYCHWVGTCSSNNPKYDIISVFICLSDWTSLSSISNVFGELLEEAQQSMNIKFIDNRGADGELTHTWCYVVQASSGKCFRCAKEIPRSVQDLIPDHSYFASRLLLDNKEVLAPSDAVPDYEFSLV